MAENPRPIRAIMGPEPLLVSEAVMAVRQATLTAAADFNRDEIDLADGGSGALLAAARTLPVMAPLRFVHGYNLHKLTAKEHEPLIAYLKNPERQSVVVLSGERPDGRLKLIQALRRAGALDVLEVPKPHALPHWLMCRAKKEDFELTPQAAQAMVTQLGDAIGPLIQALELLHVYAGPGGRIEQKDVTQALPHVRETSIFALCDAVSAGLWEKAAVALDSLLRDDDEPLAILAMLTRQLRMLLGARTFVGRAQELPAALGAPPFVANKVAHACQRLCADDWRALLNLAQATDVKLRTDRRSAAALMRAFVLALCGRDTKRSNADTSQIAFVR